MLELKTIPPDMLKENASLRYERLEIGETIQVKAYYDKDNKLVKIIEEYREGKNDNSGTRTYFFEKIIYQLQ
jgi:hypothetical protein